MSCDIPNFFQCCKSGFCKLERICCNTQNANLKHVESDLHTSCFRANCLSNKMLSNLVSCCVLQLVLHFNAISNIFFKKTFCKTDCGILILFKDNSGIKKGNSFVLINCIKLSAISHERFKQISYICTDYKSVNFLCVKNVLKTS